jgi:hypothetical protein
MSKDTSGLLFDQDGNPMKSFRGQHIVAYEPGELVTGDRIIVGESLRFYEPMPSLELLGAFVQLEEGADKEIYRFAKRHGMLGLCKHGKPPYHLRSSFCQPGEARSEKLAAWRHYASRAGALLRLASEIDANRCGALDDWNVLGTWSFGRWHSAPRPKQGIPEDPNWRKALVASEVSHWLVQCWLRPAIEWDEPNPTFRLRTDTLIGVIGVSLMTAILRRGGLATCSACGSPYVPKRKPASGRNQFCSSCGKTGAKRAWAQKQSEAKRLATTGPRR